MSPEAKMAWYKNRMMYLSAILGGFIGVLFLIAGLWLEMRIEKLPFSYWSYLYLHRTHYLFYLLDAAPFGFGLLFGLIGLQHSSKLAILRSKKEWETTFDALSDLIFITDKDGRIIRCNHAVLDRLNLPSMKVIGRQLKDVLGEGQQKDTGEVDYPGSEFPWFGRIYDMAIYLIQMEGEPENIICVMHDITERKRVEETLRENEEKWRSLFEILPVGVSIINTADRVTDLNPALFQILDISKEGLLNGDYRCRKYLRSDNTPMPAEEFPSARAAKEKKRMLRSV
jgi:PAS domain S-box-containing protein